MQINSQKSCEICEIWQLWRDWRMLSFRVQAELADDETAVGFVVFVSRDERNAITLAKEL